MGKGGQLCGVADRNSAFDGEYTVVYGEVKI